MIRLTINDEVHEIPEIVDPERPLLWVLRDHLGLTGTKFGCGAALCGACTVLVDGEPVRSCSFPVSSAAGTKVTTIEGVARDTTNPVIQAWEALQVAQCGYCQSGQIMAALALLRSNPKPSDLDIDRAMTNLCRCGTYGRIRLAIKRASAQDHG